jgi:TatA/E family protein of Tat protein translocase
MNLGLPEIVVIAVVALLVFGPSRLPELSRAIGRGMREFRKAVSEIEERIETETQPPPNPDAQDALPPAPGTVPTPPPPASPDDAQPPPTADSRRD